MLSVGGHVRTHWHDSQKLGWLPAVHGDFLTRNWQPTTDHLSHGLTDEGHDDG
jgi:hypothetical protein